MAWTTDDIPDQRGRFAIVTGANSGLGLETVRALAAKGAQVVLACRDAARAEEAMADVRTTVPDADLEARSLDLASLASVRAFADGIDVLDRPVDLLVNNAGVMAIPRRETADGFEMQLGTNHLGHFALTGLLLPRVLGAAAGRVVNVSSMAHVFGRMRFDDLMFRTRYERWTVYGQSKLANLLFTHELDRRLRQQGHRAVCVAAHPGWAATNLQRRGPQADGSAVGEWLTDVANGLLGQSAAAGALPQLFAATSPEVEPGAFYGPSQLFGMRGPPRREQPRPHAQREDDAARLWRMSEELTGISVPV